MKAYVLVSTFAIVSMFGVSANAQKTQDDPRRVEAIKLFQEGLKQHNNKMEAEALATYEKSYAIYPAPNTLVNIGLQEKILGRRLKALRHFREAMRSPLLAPEGLALAKKYVAELEPSFARVDLKGPSGMVVSLGNEDVTLPLPEPLDVEPGKIVATGVMDGQPYDGFATAAAGQIATLRLHAPKADRKEEKTDYWTPQHITGVALGGAAVVAAGLGIGFWASHNSHVTDGKNILNANSNACGDQGSAECRNLRRAVNDQNSMKTAEIVSFIAAGALAVGAVVLLVPWQTKKEGSQVSARIVPTGQGVLIDGAF